MTRLGALSAKALVLAAPLVMVAACSGSDRAASKPTTTRATTTTTTTTVSTTTSTAGSATTQPPLTDDVRAVVDVDLTGSVKLHATFAKPDGCRTGAPKLPFVVLVVANSSDGSRIRFSPSLPVAGTFTLGDPTSASSLEGVVLEVAGPAGSQLSAPQTGTVTFDDAQGRAGHFRLSGLQSTSPSARDEVLDVSWTCG